MLVIKTNKETYHAGDVVKIQLILCNDTSTEQTYEFPTSQQFDVFVEEGSNVVWTWSDGQLFAQFFSTLTLQPSECKMYNVNWDQTNSAGQQVSPGTYTVRGIIKGTNLEATETIVIS